MNSTDLHIKYHMETGEDHQWWARSTGQFHSTENYSREYATWLEEQLLEELKKKKNVEALEEEVIYLQNTVDELEDKNTELNNEVEFWVDHHNNKK